MIINNFFKLFKYIKLYPSNKSVFIYVVYQRKTDWKTSKFNVEAVSPEKKTGIITA